MTLSGEKMFYLYRFSNNKNEILYVGKNYYNHIKNMPEFATYKESLILSEDELELLKERKVEDKSLL